MSKFLLQIVAFLILVAPVIILGWIGFVLLDWPGLALGAFIGIGFFVYNVNQAALQEEGVTSTLRTPDPIHPDASIAPIGKIETGTIESKQA